jgi:hypothetical protein
MILGHIPFGVREDFLGQWIVAWKDLLQRTVLRLCHGMVQAKGGEGKNAGLL